MIIKVKREIPINGALPSRIYLDSDFFGYGLENENFSIPAGQYNVTGKRSEKFGANKIYIDVPGRSGILFHGGNTKDDTRGCILIASRRQGDTISGDISGELYERVNGAANAGEGVGVVVYDYFPWSKIALFAAVVGLIYIANKRKTR